MYILFISGEKIFLFLFLFLFSNTARLVWKEIPNDIKTLSTLGSFTKALKATL